MDAHLSLLGEGEDIIGSATSVEDIVAALSRRGCSDLTSSINLGACSEIPLAGGGFCDVYRGRLRNGTLVAIKSLRVYDSPEGGSNRSNILKHAAKELYYWSKMRHRNVLPLLGLTLFRGHISMISEWMDNGNLTMYLARNPDVDRVQLCMDICEGLCYIHRHDMVHGDLKAANVLVSSNGNAMIADFGSAQLKDLTLRFTGTVKPGISVRWAAPELVFDDAKTSKASDVFAYGMTALETLSGEVPYAGKSDTRVLGLLAQGTIPSRPRSGISDALWSIITTCWNWNPNKRPTAMSIMDRLLSLAVLNELFQTERIHGSKYPLSELTSGFGRSSALKSSVLNQEFPYHHHKIPPVKPYQCPLLGCDYTTAIAFNMIPHTRIVHNCEACWLDGFGVTYEPFPSSCTYGNLASHFHSSDDYNAHMPPGSIQINSTKPIINIPYYKVAIEGKQHQRMKHLLAKNRRNNINGSVEQIFLQTAISNSTGDVSYQFIY